MSRDGELPHGPALRWLLTGGSLESYNLGTGAGTTVRGLLNGLELAAGEFLPVEMAARRAGDAPILVGDNRKARVRLGWKPVRDLDAIRFGAWRWHQGQTLRLDTPRSAIG